MDLGEISVPENETSAALFENKTVIAGSDFSIQGAVACGPSDDADRSLYASLGIKNSGMEMLQKVVARLTLFDRDGQQIEQGEVEDFVAPASLDTFSKCLHQSRSSAGASIGWVPHFLKQ